MSMDIISLDKNKQKKLSKKVKTIKKTLKDGKTKIEDNGLKKAHKKNYFNKRKGIIYIGHLPHGFYENEMSEYFSQFGKVIAAVVARSKKTGRSRGYGFVEFLDEEVAKIAAESMNNYLMYNKILKCRYIPPTERKHKLYISPPLTTMRRKHLKENLKLRNNLLNNFENKTYLKQVKTKINQFKKFFEEKGIDFTFNVVNDSFKESVESESSKENREVKETDLFSKSEEVGVLEIDESDDEIQFKTPPQTKKVFKKSSSATCELEGAKKKISRHNKIKNVSISQSKITKAKINTRKSKIVSSKNSRIKDSITCDKKNLKTISSDVEGKLKNKRKKELTRKTSKKNLKGRRKA